MPSARQRPARFVLAYAAPPFHSQDRNMTVIATRTLTLHTGAGDVEIPVRVFAPERDDNGWICRFAIDWPEGKRERWGAGEDAMQALLHALQIIGVSLYTSEHHKSGKL